MWLDTLQKKHYRALYEIMLRAEPWNRCTFEQFEGIASGRSGYVIIAPTGELAGCISFSDLAPDANIIIHCFVDGKYRRRWATRQSLKTIAEYVFNTLNLCRISGYSIEGISDIAGKFLLKLGFQHEGTIRRGRRIGDSFYNVKIYGLLKEECKWR